MKVKWRFCMCCINNLKYYFYSLKRQEGKYIGILTPKGISKLERLIYHLAGQGRLGSCL